MILIVDDEPLIHTLFRSFAEAYGVECASLYNGLGAVNIAKSHDIDVIFLDIIMDKQEGLKTLEELETYCDCYVVTISSDLHYLEVSKALGADEALLKPVTYEDFCRVMDNEKRRDKSNHRIKNRWT